MTLKERLKLVEVDSWPEHKRKLFHQMVSNGESISMAHLLASRRFPQLNGNIDSEFGKAMRSKMESMTPLHRQLLLNRAKRAGIKVDGKYLLPGFSPENPEAWVTTVDEAAATYKRNNLNAEGVVNVSNQVEPEEKQSVRLAPDIVDRLANEKLARDPDLKAAVTENPKKLKELKEQVVSEHGPPTDS